MLWCVVVVDECTADMMGSQSRGDLWGGSYWGMLMCHKGMHLHGYLGLGWHGSVIGLVVCDPDRHFT